MSTRGLIVGLVALIAAAPPLAAAWAYHGDYEPSTQEDLRDGMMFTSPYAGSQNRVYFNGFVEQSCVGRGSANPNVGDPAVRSEIVGPCDNYMALLGVWADCNGDGYVGLGEAGFQEYRTEILTAAPPPSGIPAVCQPVPTRPVSEAGLAAWHNDGNWVREYVPIGWSPAPNATGVVDDYNVFSLKDNSSRVWVDPQLAGNDGGHGACLLGLQSESTQSVGGFLYWADCSLGRRTIGAINLVADTSGHPELGFSDADQHEYDSNSELNIWNPYGQQDQDSMVTVWDCQADKKFEPRDPTSTQEGQPGDLWRVQDPTYDGSPNSAVVGDVDGWINITRDDGDIVHGANVSGTQSPTTNVPPPSTNPGKPGRASIAGTVNATVSGTDQCARNTDSQRGNNADFLANPYALVESGFPAAAAKTTPHDNLVPSTSARRAYDGAYLKVYDPTSGDANNDGKPDTLLVNDSIPEPLGHTTGVNSQSASVPTKGTLVSVDVPFSINRFDAQGVNGGFYGLWAGLGGFVIEGPGVDSNNGNSAGIVYNRYYAYVTPRPFLTLPSGGTPHTYGGNDEITGAPRQCGAHIEETAAAAPTLTNVYNGWDCKTGDWYQDLTGGDLTPRSAFLGCDRNNAGVNQNDPNLCKKVRVGAIVGEQYDLKDLDCWDMSVKPARDNDVSTGLEGDWGGDPTHPTQCDHT